MDDQRVAFVTGASRGIGKAIAVALARAGYDVAVTARTIDAGEEREHSSTVARSDTSPLPGSLRETAALIEAEGRRALMAPADLVDRASLGAAATLVLERWGHVDVVVHNARFIGPGHMDTFLGAPISAIEQHMQGNFFAPLVLNKYFVPAMVAQGKGLIVNITSGAGLGNPPAAAGEGGWGLSYGASKGAFQRIAGIFALELTKFGIATVNVEPGYVVTERIIQDMGGFGFSTDGAPPEVVGVVVAHLATADNAKPFNGRSVFAQDFCHEHGLLPTWPGPKPRSGPSGVDPAAAHLAALDAEDTR